MRKSAGVLIYKTNPYRVLLVQSYGCKYGPAKGHFEDIDTTPEECASRELYEETGIRLSPSLLASYRRTRIDKTYIFYVPLSPSMSTWRPNWRQIDKEITDIRWFSPYHITGIALNNVGKRTLQKFISHCERNPDVKDHLNITPIQIK